MVAWINLFHAQIDFITNFLGMLHLVVAPSAGFNGNLEVGSPENVPTA